MAKRRDLKKDISYIAGELFTEVLVIKMLFPGIEHDKCDELMTRVIDIQENYLSRVNGLDAKQNKARVKEYYKKLRTDLQAEIDALVAEIEVLSKSAPEA
ncbi:hypothetical protein LJC57_05960 [Parabacteroides sp. OttesenSCG-928-G07]|nr:hypothetical protein [Parabacteroides sp. OttesenSCG-928-G21]MDL2278119.1 hypothetical protein [Parabacteroides sp. OttesenSCG-928-G07]